MGVTKDWFNHADRDNPCVRDCPDRSSECHGHCERYARYAAKNKQRADERQQRSREQPRSYRMFPPRKPY